MQRKEPSRPAPAGLSITVSIASQTATIHRDGKILVSFPVSTSKFGIGFEPGSFKTPTGRFEIAEKIGDNLPSGSVLRGRVPTGEIYTPENPGTLSTEEDLILTRILRLRGLDPANENTWDRYIYFHGTNQEALLGHPASHGCIRLSNADMLELFALIPVGTPVEILPPQIAPTHRAEPHCGSIHHLPQYPR